MKGLSIMKTLAVLGLVAVMAVAAVAWQPVHRSAGTSSQTLLLYPTTHAGAKSAQIVNNGTGQLTASLWSYTGSRWVQVQPRVGAGTVFTTTASDSVFTLNAGEVLTLTDDISPQYGVHVVYIKRPTSTSFTVLYR